MARMAPVSAVTPRCSRPAVVEFHSRSRVTRARDGVRSGAVVVGELEAARARLHGRLDRSEGELLGDARRQVLGIGAAQELHGAIAVGHDEIGGDRALPFDADDADAQTGRAACSVRHHLVQERHRLRIGRRRGRLARRPLLAQQAQQLLEPVHARRSRRVA